MKNNKESASIKFTAKEDPAFAGMGHTFDVNKLTPPSAIAIELEAAGYDYRWINETVFRQNYNMHRSGWKPYHVVNKRAMPSEIDSEGCLRRGDLLLAVRPREMTIQHRQRINEANIRQSGKALRKKKAEEFKQVIKETGLDQYGGGQVAEIDDSN